MTAPPAADDRILTFVSGGQTLGVPARDVAEVIALPRLTRVPLSPPALRGLANVRGRATPVLSLDRLMPSASDESAADEAAAQVVVLRREPPLGLAVTRAIGVVDIDETVPHLDVMELLARALAQLPRGRAVAAPSAQPPAPPPAAEVRASVLMFEIDGQNFALPLPAVLEVVKRPDRLMQTPDMGAAILGATLWRDETVAVVCLSDLLGLSRPPPGRDTHLIVVQLGETCVALMVDRVRAILRPSAGDLRPAPALLNRGGGEATVDRILRTPEGLVAVLAVDRLFDDDTLSGLGAGARRDDGPSAPVAGASRAFVRFSLADEVYALPVDAVEAIVPAPVAVRPPPGAPDFLVGLINHRGVVTPLLDQRRRFGVDVAPAGSRGKVIVLRVGDVTAGLVADDVERLIAVSDEALVSTEEVASGDAAVFDRMVTREGEAPLLVVEPRRLLDQAERDIVIQTLAKAGTAA
jgi:purine-binding chemotaxis protein CheW